MDVNYGQANGEEGGGVGAERKLNQAPPPLQLQTEKKKEKKKKWNGHANVPLPRKMAPKRPRLSRVNTEKKLLVALCKQDLTCSLWLAALPWRSVSATRGQSHKCTRGRSRWQATLPRVGYVGSYYQQSSQESRIVPKRTEASRRTSLKQANVNQILFLRKPQRKKKRKNLLRFGYHSINSGQLLLAHASLSVGVECWLVCGSSIVASRPTNKSPSATDHAAVDEFCLRACAPCSVQFWTSMQHATCNFHRATIITTLMLLQQHVLLYL